MTTLFRKLLDPPSPRRMMVELLLIWLVVDAFLLYLAALPNDFLQRRYIACTLAFLLLLASQLSASLLWTIMARWRISERILFPVGLLASAATLWRTVIFLPESYPYVYPEATSNGGLTLVLHSATFAVLATIFRCCGATIHQHANVPSPDSPFRLSLADLFIFTTTAGLICFSALTIPRDRWHSRTSWESAGAFQWISLSTSLFLLIAASRRRVWSYLLWLGIPLILLNVYAFLVIVSSSGLGTYLHLLPLVAIINLFLLIYPLGLILSLEYLRLRGYTFARKRQSSANGDGAAIACAAGDGT